ncbi:MAG: DUF1003 domain-containing protein [Candidatus Pacearchaeota archaeon]|nr:DUF1003 domain-containing protein [Candidatus Pacearchaeota archaeon]
MKKEDRQFFQHLEHPVFKQHRRTFGEKAADMLAKLVGSWAFIIFLALFLSVWIISNGYFLVMYEEGKPFDPYPFILLNLFVGCLSAIYTPIILMSQNRESKKDRIKAEYDYRINKKAEKEIREIKEMLIRKRK